MLVMTIVIDKGFLLPRRRDEWPTASLRVSGPGPGAVQRDP